MPSDKRVTLLIINGYCHAKNKQGLESILNSLGWQYCYGDVGDLDTRGACIVYSPSTAIDTSRYPDTKFIFGPHFSVFPDDRLNQINNVNQNSIYILPSQWVVDFWRQTDFMRQLQESQQASKPSKIVPLITFSFPVDTERFAPDTDTDRQNIFIYFKHRERHQLQSILAQLRELEPGNKVRIFEYGHYKEDDYLQYLKASKYGIVIDAHESQGFAIQEALSCDVPLLVWNVTSLSQEAGSNYPDLYATCVPYWDSRCGGLFYRDQAFSEIYQMFTDCLDKYRPREFVLENLAVESRARAFVEIVSNINI